MAPQRRFEATACPIDWRKPFAALVFVLMAAGLPFAATAQESGLIVLAQVDVDTDGDGIKDTDDNCPADPNPNQENQDSDGMGDECDADDDNDGLADDGEATIGSDPLKPDTDTDGFCDGPGLGDGSCVPGDNCPNQFNPGQENSDAHPAGDLCQCGDVTDDGIIAAEDESQIQAFFFTQTPPPPPWVFERCDVSDDDADGVDDCTITDKLRVTQWLTGGDPTILTMVCDAYTTPIIPPPPAPPEAPVLLP